MLPVDLVNRTRCKAAHSYTQYTHTWNWGEWLRAHPSVKRLWKLWVCAWISQSYNQIASQKKQRLRFKSIVQIMKQQKKAFYAYVLSYSPINKCGDQKTERKRKKRSSASQSAYNIINLIASQNMILRLTSYTIRRVIWCDIWMSRWRWWAAFEVNIFLYAKQKQQNTASSVSNPLNKNY